MAILHLVRQNILRNKKTLLVSSIGLIIGIASLVFFLALGNGVKRVVLEDMFAIRQIEVVPRTYDFGFTKFSIVKLDERAIDKLSSIPDVDDIYPKMKWTFPAWATGGKEVLGKNFRAEVIADGIAPHLADDLTHPERFRDWDSETPCSMLDSENRCPPAQRCIANFCQKISCDPDAPQIQCPEPTYCTRDTHTCDMPIPIIVNPSLLNVYNSGLTTALSSGTGVKLPKLTAEALTGFIFDVELGNSYLGEAAQNDPIQRKMQCVGLSSKAIPVGFTMPISYVRRFNTYFSGEKQGRTYHSIVLEAHSNSAVSKIAERVRELGFELDESHAQADRIGLMITVLTLLFSLISLLIVSISAINIAQTFFMMIAERRQELGIFRALGATRTHIAQMILLEGTFVGLVGAIFGILLAVLAIQIANVGIRHNLPDMMIQASSFFDLSPQLILAAIACGIIFCLLGCARPAWRAAHIDPVRAMHGGHI
ncbi:MAG: FtsX-like permease family protein [Proteobacteria bacterium]|nr:FtsX-like permease family protein [Pseudomonadota bacterium]